MKHLRVFVVLMMATFVIWGCKEGNSSQQTGGNDSLAAANAGDSTIYGKCGEGSMMHTLELIDDEGKVHHFMINMDDSSVVQGGMLTGDRMAVIRSIVYGDTMATTVINLTTLQGKWSSLAKSFQIEEGGKVTSNADAESNPWTTWKIFNGKLVLNTDTFTINELRADSLFLENKEGIFAFQRLK